MKVFVKVEVQGRVCVSVFYFSLTHTVIYYSDGALKNHRLMQFESRSTEGLRTRLPSITICSLWRQSSKGTHTAGVPTARLKAPDDTRKVNEVWREMERSHRHICIRPMGHRL